MYLISPSVSSQTCSAGWTYITGRCYRVFEDSKTWYESQKACQSLNGDLVVISSTDLQVNTDDRECCCGKFLIIMCQAKFPKVVHVDFISLI